MDSPYFIAFLVLAIGLYCIRKEKTPQQELSKDDRSKPFTVAQIREFDGKNGKQTYIGLNGFVFDVSSSASFKEGGDYANFAGRDISIACANYSTDDKYLDETYDPNDNHLKFDQMQNILQFYIMFCQKYTVVGYVELKPKD